MDALREAVELATFIVFVLLALVAGSVHRQRRSEASRWLLVTFGVMAAALVLARVLPDPPAQSTAEVMARQAVVILVAAFPYNLFRFAAAFTQPSRRLQVIAAGAFGLIVLATLLLNDPTVPRDTPRTAQVTVFVSAYALYWTVLSAWVIAALWRASTVQATVARRRLRFLAAAAAFLNLALLMVALPDASAVLSIVANVLAIVSAAGFVLGFAPPPVVRREWRVSDEQRLREAEHGLLAANDADAVAAALLPPLASLFGGEAAYLDAQGRTVAAAGAVPTPADRPPSRPAAGEVEVLPNMLALGLQQGSLVVRANAFTPFFGTEEIGLLRGAGASLDLAMSRVVLQEREREARRAAEETNAELEALLYGISHDLRAPLVAMTGYVELLAEGDSPPEERSFVLDRITANTAYMDALIRDLLELSRVGRIDERPEPVDLDALGRELELELRLQHPAAHIQVGPLPTVVMGRVRARQLFGNLLTNALRHSGRDDVTVTLSAFDADDGVVVSVADDGVGIAPEHRSRVFGIFERLQGRDERSGGTGIGLAMCRKIVEHVGGSMWIADSATGTDIRFLVPHAAVRQSPQRSLEMNP